MLGCDFLFTSINSYDLTLQGAYKLTLTSYFIVPFSNCGSKPMLVYDFLFTSISPYDLLSPSV